MGDLPPSSRSPERRILHVGRDAFFAAIGRQRRPELKGKPVTRWEPKSFSRETTFQADVRDWQVIGRTLADLASEAVRDRKGHRCKARTVAFKIRLVGVRDSHLHTEKEG